VLSTLQSLIDDSNTTIRTRQVAICIQGIIAGAVAIDEATETDFRSLVQTLVEANYSIKDFREAVQQVQYNKYDNVKARAIIKRLCQAIVAQLLDRDAKAQWEEFTLGLNYSPEEESDTQAAASPSVSKGDAATASSSAAATPLARPKHTRRESISQARGDGSILRFSPDN
jgi:septin family protein